MLIRHQANDLLGDFTILANGACRLKDRHDRLERIAMDARDPLDFLDPVGSMLVEIVAGTVPVRIRIVDLILRDEAGDRLNPRQKLRMLPKPSGPLLGDRQGDPQHVDFPSSEKAAARLPPLQIPIPDAGENEEPERQLPDRHPVALHLSISGCCKGTEHQPEMLDLL